MDNLLDIYTKIKLRIGTEIIVTYYEYGHKYTRKITLLNICEFVYLFGINSTGEEVDIYFFYDDMMIESIKFVDDKLPVYYNPYINKEIFNGYNKIDDDCLLEIKNKMLGEEYDSAIFSSEYIARDTLIEKYIARDSTIKYDDLFFSDRQKEEFELFFKLLVDELSLYAKRNNMDSELKFICASTTSLIYEIGDKIIKIGKPRRCNYIPYCEYILQPIINRNFSFDGYPIHVEVTQKVFVLENKDGCVTRTDDERFNEAIDEIGKSLYSIGIFSRDLHPGNIGILLDDNKIHYDDINFDVGCDKTTSIESNNNLRILKRGRFVIIDLDCLKIDDVIKYTNYLKFIGYDEDKVSDLIYHTKCLVRR